MPQTSSILRKDNSEDPSNSREITINDDEIYDYETETETETQEESGIIRNSKELNEEEFPKKQIDDNDTAVYQSEDADNNSEYQYYDYDYDYDSNSNTNSGNNLIYRQKLLYGITLRLYQ